MNCQEVMDYMQRQLDGDLDERETEILMNHTRHCSECAAMFERLKRLSEGLESLPKVTPSYSLVDAILPKLAELSAAEEARTAEPPPIVVAGEGTNPPRRTQKSGDGWRRWLPMSAAGGVIAAGVIVGMFFLSSNGTHTLRDSADSGNMAASSDTASSADSTVMSNAMKDNDAAADAGSDGGAASKNDAGVSTQGADKSKAANDGGGELRKDQKIAVDPNGEAMPPITGGRSSGGADADKSYSPNYATGSSGAGDTASGGGNAPAAESDQTMSAAGGGVAADKASNGGGNASALAPDNNKSASSEPPVMASPISPDKQYQAFIVDGDTVSVYTVGDSELKYQSAKRTGIADLKWSNDDKLTYTAIDADGVKKTFAVDPKTGTEQTQSSK
ncbi:zf-HC2 domain-containing protein [Paenibacillus sp. MWE-103]|uniref:Zf-HC2 domain-containing protein n=1 Tax=Paenibacillus artemisiicola TaxID=1172618 RepID=A0ABS3WDV5_9BACL|nr:zf-HC2 domain-containing protein [Paenibacillus artemisiicola]MBO7746496.1 zf-HC2 domain-containing protein [Paenibacillus artemisiicola]